MVERVQVRRAIDPHKEYPFQRAGNRRRHALRPVRRTFLQVKLHLLKPAMRCEPRRETVRHNLGLQSKITRHLARVGCNVV